MLLSSPSVDIDQVKEEGFGGESDLELFEGLVRHLASRAALVDYSDDAIVVRPDEEDPGPRRDYELTGLKEPGSEVEPELNCNRLRPTDVPPVDARHGPSLNPSAQHHRAYLRPTVIPIPPDVKASPHQSRSKGWSGVSWRMGGAASRREWIQTGRRRKAKAECAVDPKLVGQLTVRQFYLEGAVGMLRYALWMSTTAALVPGGGARMRALWGRGREEDQKG